MIICVDWDGLKVERYPIKFKQRNFILAKDGGNDAQGDE